MICRGVIGNRRFAGIQAESYLEISTESSGKLAALRKGYHEEKGCKRSIISIKRDILEIVYCDLTISVQRTTAAFRYMSFDLL